MTNRLSRFLLSFGTLLLAAPCTPLLAQQPLETETARPPKKGVVEIQTTFEYQTAKEGKEAAAPLAFEYGITDRWTILIEPVLFTGIRPKLGPHA